MAASELCKDGTLVSLESLDDRLYLYVTEADQERSAGMYCDPDVLVAVLRGMTYQLASEGAYCIIRRDGKEILVESQSGAHQTRCRLTNEEYGKLITPVVPPRLRALLL